MNDIVPVGRSFYRLWAIEVFGRSDPYECVRLLFNVGFRGRDLRW